MFWSDLKIDWHQSVSLDNTDNFVLVFNFLRSFDFTKLTTEHCNYIKQISNNAIRELTPFTSIAIYIKQKKS